MDQMTTMAPVPTNMPAVQAIGQEQTKKLVQILEKYKAGKAITERRIVASENWWKLRNNAEEAEKSWTMALPGFKSTSGWLHNVIANKHADAMEAYPEPNILPREQDDRAEAYILSAIMPCIMEQNHFESIYSDVAWQKLKTGTGVYKIVWDKDKLNGLGDITIAKVNLLNIYWEPGVTDIQKSRYFFHTELVDKEALIEQFPQLDGKLNGTSFLSTKFLYDDSVSTDGKVTVVECYYKKYVHGKCTLQYVRFVNDQVLFSTENDPQLASRGLYDHGKYPYVFDAMYPIEGSPCGYGFVDLCKSPQTAIDLLNTTFIKNAMAGASPRYFKRMDGGVNEEEFLDLTKTIVNVNGNLGEDSLRQINFQPLDGIYVNLQDRIIQELRETSGNTETATGTASSGVTAASAIAALQEASGKGSRDSNLAAYRAYAELVNFGIELIRQFYDMPRQFRIVGQYGAEQFITYSNKGLQPQAQGMAFGTDMGYRLPVFDIKVSAQKKNVYTKVSQNELALQFFQLGFFNPQLTDQTLMCLDLMDFDGKDTVMQKVSQNGTMYQKMLQYMQMSLQLAKIAAPDMVAGLSQDIMETMGVASQSAPAMSDAPDLSETDNLSGGEKGKEITRVSNAREKALNASQPDGGRVTKEAQG